MTKVSPGRVPFPLKLKYTPVSLGIVGTENIRRIFNTFSSISEQLEKTGQKPVWCGHLAPWRVLQELWTKTFRNFCPGRSRGGDFPERA